MASTQLPPTKTLTVVSPRSPAPNRRRLPAAVAALLALYLVAPAFLPPTDSPSPYHALFLSLADNGTAAAHLRELTRRPHVAGTAANGAAAAHVLHTFASLSIPASSVFYDVLLSYPVHRSLSLFPNAGEGVVGTFFDLTQESFPGDPFAEVEDEVIPTFHAYAKSGSVTSVVVYANYGRVEDFAFLSSVGVNVSRAIVLARYGKIYRGDIVRNAMDAGAVAAIVYSDVKDYGGDGQGKWFPDGPWLPPSGVQIGSLLLAQGDPMTPGWACPLNKSEIECERLGMRAVSSTGLLPGIPSLPVSGRDGETIQRAIGGAVAPDDWQGSEGAPVYRLGPGPGIVNLTYLGDEKIATIQNVIAVIEGSKEPDRYDLSNEYNY